MAQIIITKICSNCCEKKLLTKFYKNNTSRDGLFGPCIECIKQKKQLYVNSLRNRTEVPKISEKRCSCCKSVLPILNFLKNRTKKDGYNTEREICRKKNDKRYTGTNKKRNIVAKNKKDYNLLINYGITIDDFNQMIQNQKNCCAICQKTLSVQEFHVDHCHQSGQVRGLLCQKCNLGLGFFKDDAILLQNAIKYLT